MLFSTFDDLMNFTEGALTRFLGPLFVGGVITLISMFISFTWSCDVPFLWNTGHQFIAAVITLLAVIFGYSVGYFYFMAVLVDPGRAPTVAQYEAIASKRDKKAPETTDSPKNTPQEEEGSEEEEEDEDNSGRTFYTIDESVLDPSRPSKLVECIICDKCLSKPILSVILFFFFILFCA